MQRVEAAAIVETGEIVEHRELPQRALQALNHSIETLVREAPEQYQWEYKRFKRQPEGHSRPY